jgi:tetraprenyl-beta-curcumene synthase
VPARPTPLAAVADPAAPPAGTARPTGAAAARPDEHEASQTSSLRLGLVFTDTVTRYLISVMPTVTRQLGHWRARAREIPDPVLRELALDALSKRGNMEGAALFAVLAPRPRRRETVRALVAFQTAYNYLDTLAEQPSREPSVNGEQLHAALLAAIDPTMAEQDFYRYHPHSDDGGFLPDLIAACRDAMAVLPSRQLTAAALRSSAERIVTFQSLNLTDEQGGHGRLEQWARRQTPAALGLQWWQAAAAAGSSLGVHALIASSADPDLRARDVTAIESAYSPWICALHSLLDSLVDVAEDEHAGQRNLLGYHASGDETAFAMKMLARRSVTAVGTLRQSDRHRVILTAMATYYLSSPQAHEPYASATARSVSGQLGGLLDPALALFRVRRAVARRAHGDYR